MHDDDDDDTGSGTGTSHEEHRVLHLDLDDTERAALRLARELSDRVTRERATVHELGEYLRTQSVTPDARTAAAGLVRPAELVELPDLVVRVRRESAGVVVCAPTGELEAANCAQLDQVLRELEPVQGVVVLDVRDVPLVDSAALSTLLRAGRRLSTSGARLVLVNPTPPVQRVLAITGLDRVLCDRPVIAARA